MHDLNDDNHLDGLEVLAALRHGAHDNYERIFLDAPTHADIRFRVDRLNDRLARKFYLFVIKSFKYLIL